MFLLRSVSLSFTYLEVGLPHIKFSTGHRGGIHREEPICLAFPEISLIRRPQYVKEQSIEGGCCPRMLSYYWCKGCFFFLSSFPCTSFPRSSGACVVVPQSRPLYAETRVNVSCCLLSMRQEWFGNFLRTCTHRYTIKLRHARKWHHLIVRRVPRT